MHGLLLRHLHWIICFFECNGAFVAIHNWRIVIMNLINCVRTPPMANRTWSLVASGVVFLLTIIPGHADALPVFARQTGQNCVACHAGGQFPELTPYGRAFKLTGYTLGERTIPLSVMAVASSTTTRNTNDTAQGGNPRADFPKDGNAIIAGGSLFVAGKVTNNIGVFIQHTYDNYSGQSASDSHWLGHSQSDNVDIRYADRFIDPKRDLIVGLSLNNNPTVQDVFNSVPAWWFPYQTGLSATQPGFAPKIASLGQNVAGIGAYAYWNQHVYAEVAAYRAADRGIWSWMSQGITTDQMSMVKGLNPYWRIALTHEWGAHNVMVGALGMNTNQYNDPVIRDGGDTDKFRDIGLDAQYQYLLDPHALTAQASYIRERVKYGPAHNSSNASAFFDATGTISQPNFNDSDTLKFFRAKVSYAYHAKYGGSLAYFNIKGNTNAMNQTAGFDDTGALEAAGNHTGNLSGSPATRGMVSELFWTPIQYVRLGAQYTAFSRFNGASTNYDGFGRNAKDNNSLFLYVWAAY